MVDLKVGDLYYRAHRKLHYLERKKEVREIDGQQWFRYDLPRVTYEVNTYEVLGILHKQLEGKWSEDENYELEAQWYVRCVETNHSFVTDGDILDDDTSFFDKTAALAYAERKMAEDDEKDMG